MKRAFIVICDGLRNDMVSKDTTPNLIRISNHGTRYLNHGGVFPSTTRTTAASISTGCLPGRHGLLGNTMALDLGNGLEVLSVGPPEFRDRLREVTGRTLLVPAMSERLKNIGQSTMYANASAGAAIFLDPDSHGHLRHRNCAWGPGLAKSQPLGVGHDASGDAAMTKMFIDDVVEDSENILGILWQCEPDHTQHEVPLGSPSHLDAIRAADAQAGRVFDNLRPGIERGDVLFICASDHGHETIKDIVDLEQILLDAGLKSGPGSSDVVIAPQGLSATIYLSGSSKGRKDEISRVLSESPSVDKVFTRLQFREIGLDPDGPIDLVVVGAYSDEPSTAGVPGSSIAFQGDMKISNNVGCGQHGGLGPNEQHPFMICVGPGFGPRTTSTMETSAVDIAPTVLEHFDVAAEGMDGQPLQS